MVSLLDGYAAKRCPQRVVFDQHPPTGVTPLPLAEAIELRQSEGVQFQTTVLNELTEMLQTAGFVVARLDDDRDGSDTRGDTLRAMDQGVDVIIGGQLPPDVAASRTGRPDVLMRAEFDRHWRYRPVEVKGHRTMRPSPDSSVSVSPLNAFFGPPQELEDMAGLAGRRRSNGLQLAHYYRMLEAIDRQPASTEVGVIGKERLLLWMDLDDALPPSGWDSTVDAPRTLLERYDQEFAHRVNAVTAAVSGVPIVEPVWVHDCNDCPWRAHCLPLVKERQCVSTLQGVGYQAWRCCRRMGIETVDQLAGVDWHSAAVADEWPTDAVPSLPELLADPAAHGGVLREGPLADVLGRHGFGSARSLDHFDHRVLERLGWPMGRLAAHVDEARARSHAPDSACLRRGLDQLVVPSFDREIDIDMESGVSGLAYLWGTYEAATDNATYDADWSADPDHAAAHVFVAFWTRLSTLRREAEDAGQSIGFYCWHDEAEKTALRRGAEAAARLLGFSAAPDEVEAFFDTGTLVDLCALARRDLITGGSKGLKVMAPLAGFSWRDDDPDGAASMVWHRRATTRPGTDGSDPADTAAWRRRLIEYNEDDVRAEAAVRQWMRTTPFASVENLGSS